MKKRFLFYLTALTVLSPLAAPKAMAQTQSTEETDQGWTGTDPATAASATSDGEKTVYFYNVGKKMFLGRGGRWGTECALSEVGQSFKVSSVSNSTGYRFNSNTTAEAATSNGYLYTPGTDNKHDLLNFFTDAKTGGIFYFEAVPEKTNTYKIYLYRGSDTYTTQTSGTKYYMVGSYNSSSSSLSTLSSTAIDMFESLTNITDNSDEWILVTQKERHDAFSKNKIQRLCKVPGNFLIQDGDFARKDTDISNWKQSDGTTSLTQGWNSNLPDISSTTTYYVGNGSADGTDGRQGDNGTYMAANMIGSDGAIKQTIDGETLYLHGWYEIRCQAFTTSSKGKVVLYAKAGDASETESNSGYCEANVPTNSTRPTTYLAAAQAVDDDKYQISVLVYVDKAVKTQAADDETCKPLEFGVKISDGENSDLTTIDNFELIYRGQLTDRIILDETLEGTAEYNEVATSSSNASLQTNVNYMQAQNNVRTQENMCEVYLKRTLKKDQWNSIILPIRLTNDDVKGFWGDNIVVSEFKGATDKNNPHIINFVATTDGIYPGKLYLIKPSALNTTTLNEAVTSTNAVKKSSTNTNDEAITLAANTENVYKIDAPKYGVDADGNVVTYSSGVVKGTAGKELYENESENVIQYAGTWFKKNGVVPGESYYISNNKWYYSAKNVTNNSKGFRAWIQRASTSESSTDNAKSYAFYINGVNATGYETTAIEGISADSTMPAQFNIYNVSGQLVRKNATSLDNLAKGIYIVAGKKYIVK